MHANHTAATAAARSLAALPSRSPLALALAAALTFSAPAAAQVASTQLPAGGSIAGGTGTIQAPSGATQVITQTSNRMALTWSSFDVGSAATVRFDQPSTGAAVLNLIGGSSPSQIFGNLSSNGQVFLINSRGVLFGNTAQVNVGGLVASSLGTTASAFMSENDALDAGGGAARVSNSGTITAAAGSVNLIGGQVVNDGTITATAGNITLAGADRATLTFESGGFGVIITRALQSQLATLAVQNTGSLIAPGNTISLQASAASGVFSQLINNSGIISAASLSSAGSDGNVSLIATGATGTSIGGSGSINVDTGSIGYSAGAGGIEQTGVLTAGDLGATAGGNMLLTGSNQIAGIRATVGGNLSVTNARSLGQTDVLDVNGTSTFALGNNVIMLNNAGNDFTGAVNITAGATRIDDGNALTLGTLSTGNLIANSSGALNLGSGTITGTLTATSNNGAITQTNALTVTGVSSVNAGTGAITLTNGNNDFQQALALTGGLTSLTDRSTLTLGTLNTGNLTATSNGALNLGSGTITGTLTATSNNGAITQTNALTVTGVSSVNAGTGAITLTNGNNDFQQALALTGGLTSLTDRSTLTLGTLNTGNLTATSSGALNLGSGTIDGTLVATSNNGAISQSTGSGLTVAGTSNLQAGTGAITLTAGSNDFRQAVSLAGGNTQIADSGALTLGTLSTGDLTVINNGALDLGSGTVNGVLVATSNNGAIVQSAGSGLTVTGTGNLQAGTGAITLTTGSNDFRQAVSLTGGITQIADGGALTLGALNTGNLTATSNGTLNLGSGTVAGTLSATSGNAAIGQADALIVTGAANLDAGSSTIALNDVDNDFRSGVSLAGTGISVHDRDDLTVTSLTSGANGAIALTAEGALTLPTQNLSTGTGALSLTTNVGALSTLGNLAGGNVSLRARDGLSLNHDVNASGTLGLTASNASITQTAGVLDVGGLASVDAGTGAISLERDNDFKGGIALTGRNIGVVDANDLSVTSLVNGGTGSIALTARNALSLPATGLTSDGVMTLRAENGALALGGDLVGDAISLFSGNALTLATSISSLTGSGTLSVSTNNSAINQTAGILSIGGASSFNAGSSSIGLGRIDNDFRGAVNLTGSGTLVRDSNALTLGAVSTGALTAISDGALSLGSGSADILVAISSGHAITQTGALTVRQASAVIAGGGSITLDNANNDFQSGLTLAGSGITVQDRNDLTLTSLTSNSNGNVVVTTGGSLTLPATSVNAGGGDLNLTANGGRVNIGGSLSGRNVALSARDGMTLSQSINATRNLALSTTNAAITQNAGALTAGGATTVDAGTGSIALLGAGNHFNTVSLAGNGIGLTDSNDLRIAALTSTGNSDAVVTAGGTLSLPVQPIALGNGNLTLSSNGGTLSTGAALSGNTVTLFGRDGLTLGHTVSANALDLRSSNAAIVQSGGALNVVGVTTVDAGSGSIALNGAGNRFGTGIGLTGTGIAVADSGTLTITALNAGANGSIALTAGGALHLSAQTLDTGSADLSLIANGGSVSTSGDLRGRNVALSARDGLTIGHGITATQALTLSSTNAAITQTAAALAVGTTATIDAGGGNVALGQAGNAFNGVIDLTAGDARIAGNALTFGTLSTNALTASSNGALNLGRGVVRSALNGSSGNAAITQSGALSVGGASTLNAGSGDISLINPHNDFGGAVSLTARTARIVDANAFTLGQFATGALSVTSNGVLDLGTGSAASLSASSSGGAIQQTGALVIAGDSLIDAGAGTVTLNDGGNDFVGTVAVNAGAVQLRDVDALSLATSRMGAIEAVAGGDITQTGVLSVTGNASFDAGLGAIALVAPGNDFGGVVSLRGSAVGISDTNALTLGQLVTSTLEAASNGDLNLGFGVVAGTLSARSNGGAIRQDGSLRVLGDAVLDAGSGAITLTDPVNDLAGKLTLNASSARIRTGTPLTLGMLNVGELQVSNMGALNLGQGMVGTLAASSFLGSVSQTGPLVVSGSSFIQADFGDFRLDNVDNDFVGALSVFSREVTLIDRNALTLANVGADSLTVTSTGALNLGMAGVRGDLRATSNGGAIGQTFSIGVGGASMIDAGTGTITLTHRLNDFQGGVSLFGGASQIADRNALSLDTFTVTNLSVTSNAIPLSWATKEALTLGSGRIDGTLTAISNGGDIVQRGALSVGGATTIDTSTTSFGAEAGSITLTGNNAFAGAVSLTGGATQLNAGSALTLGALNTSELTVTSNDALNLGQGSINGALTATSNGGSISQAGALVVNGTSTLDAGNGAIALDNASNDFAGAVNAIASGIELVDRNDLQVASLQGGGNASVSLDAGGTLLLPTSALDVGTGTLSLTARGGALTTTHALRGGDVQLSGANGIALGEGISASGTLRLRSTNASITQNAGTLQVTGNSVVDAGSGAITLDAAGNDFQGLLALTGGATRVRDANALTLDALNTGALNVASNGALNLGFGLVNGDLDAASNGGAVTQTGALTVTGATRIDSAGATIALADAGNDFQSALGLSGGDTRVRDRNGLTLGTLDVGALDVASGAGLDLGQGRIGGALVARSGGAAVSATPGAMTAQALAVPAADAAGINQQGALTVVGTSTLDAGTAAIVLTDAGNDFQGSVQASGGSIALADRNDLVAAAQSSGAVNLQAGGQLSSSGAISGSSVTLGSGGAMQLAHDITSAGTLSLRSGGAIAQSAGSLRAGQLGGSAAGAATLTGAGNAIGTLADFSAQGLDVFSAGTLQVGGRVDGGALLRLNSGGTLLLDGQLSGATSWLQAAAGIRQRAGSTLTANLLSGMAGGQVVLGDAGSFIDNRVARLGNFTANDGFSLTNAGDLTLVLANGSSYSVDAGNSALYLSVRGDLLQEGRATLRDGTGSFSATGRIGTQQDPIYLIGTGSQTIGFVGAPPAYFNATTAAGGLLDLAGGSGFNVPTSAFASRAQSSASRTIAFVDLSASGTPYRAFGLIRPGLRLPDDQQPACDAGDPDAVCAPQ